MTSVKILVVEDEGIVAKDLQNRLKKIGYVVPTTASSGEEAIGEIVLSVCHKGRQWAMGNRQWAMEDFEGKGNRVQLTYPYLPLPFHTPCPTPSTIFTISNSAEIPAAALPRIFEKFYRVPNANVWQQSGTGLGLALVQKLVEQLQGTIQVESSAGWTTFTLMFIDLAVATD